MENRDFQLVFQSFLWNDGIIYKRDVTLQEPIHDMETVDLTEDTDEEESHEDVLLSQMEVTQNTQNDLTQNTQNSTSQPEQNTQDHGPGMKYSERNLVIKAIRLINEITFGDECEFFNIRFGPDHDAENIYSRKDYAIYKRELIALIREMQPTLDNHNETNGHIYEDIFAKERHYFNERFNALYGDLLQSAGIMIQRENVIVDINEPVPDYIILIASLGQKFSVPNNSNKNLQQLQNEVMDLASFWDVNLDAADKKTLVEAFKEDRTTAKELLATIYSKSLTRSANYLKDKQHISIIGTDKSKKFIVMYKHAYTMKMNQHLIDTTVYQRLRISRFVGLRNRNAALLRDLKELGVITAIDCNRATTVEVDPPRIYGLIKDHKSTLPIRPVINVRKTPGEFIGHIVSEVLNFILEDHKYEVKNAYEVLVRMDNVAIEHHHAMCTLDVVSMYTNINWDMVLTALNKREIKIKEVTSIPFPFFKEMVKFCAFTVNEFEFDNTPFIQTHGLRMGSSASSSLANIVMEDILDKAFITMKRPIFIVKYVDDILIADTITHIKLIKEKIDGVYESVKTTLTEEEDNSITFLNIKLIRHPVYVWISKWYRKEFASKRILNGHSMHPKNIIESVAIEYINTALDLTDNILKSEVEAELKIIMEANNIDWDKSIADAKLHRLRRHAPKPATAKYAAISFIGEKSAKAAQSILLRESHIHRIIALRPLNQNRIFLDRFKY